MLRLKNIHKSLGDVKVPNVVKICLEKGFVYKNILLALEKRRCLLWIQ